MKESTKLKRHDQLLAELLGRTPEEIQAARDIEETDSKFREAQAVHLFLERPDAFISKTCQECLQVFLTTYKFVSVCSTMCMTKSLEKVGIDWNPFRTAEERWKRASIPIPYTIPPQALKILLQIAKLPDTEQSNNDAHTDLDSVLHELELDGSLDDNL